MIILFICCAFFIMKLCVLGGFFLTHKRVIISSIQSYSTRIKKNREKKQHSIGSLTVSANTQRIWVSEELDR